jgi:hypothetical protein
MGISSVQIAFPNLALVWAMDIALTINLGVKTKDEERTPMQTQSKS